jgi:dTDP-glucose pyrophosphorylase
VPKRKNTIAPNSPLATATERVLSGAASALAVVDESGRLVGILEDADVRRAALQDLPATATVADAMDRSPVTIPADSDEDEILRSLGDGSHQAVALVDGDRFVGLRDVSDVDRFEEPLPVAVVMAGGRGQRLRPLTDKVPKPLLKVGTTTIIERIIGALRDSGVAQFYLSVNYKADVFAERLGDGDALGVSIEYLREQKKLGTAGSLALLPEEPEGPVLVTNADILTRLDFARLFRYHREHGGLATVAVVHHVTQIPYGVMSAEGDRLVRIEEKPEVKVLCNAGIYVLQPEVLRYVAPDEALDMPDLISRLLDDGIDVHLFPVLERWFDIGSPEDFQRVLIEFATGEEE